MMTDHPPEKTENNALGYTQTTTFLIKTETSPTPINKYVRLVIVSSVNDKDKHVNRIE